MDKQTEYVLRTIEERDIRFVRLWFTDVLGILKSVSIAPAELEGAFAEGIGFDGSAIEGFSRVTESDMLAKPDPSSFQMLPWRGDDMPVGRIFCDILLPDGSPSYADPRWVLKRRLAKAAKQGFTFYTHPEIEFFLFKQDLAGRHGPDPVDNVGYFDHSPSGSAGLPTTGHLDAGAHGDLRGVLPPRGRPRAAGDRPALRRRADDRRQHHDVPVGRQGGGARHGVVASFMPKPYTNHPGSGMHTHVSLFEGDANAFFEPGADLQLSVLARQFIAGLLHHAPEITAVTNQWINSYKRLAGGMEAPSYVCWGHNNRSALIRIPMYKPAKGQSTRVEFRSLDSAARPFAYALILAAGLKGIEEKYELPPATEDDVWSLTDGERRALGLQPLPGSLAQAIEAMEGSELVAETLGEHVFDFFLRNKKSEWAEYKKHVTRFELERYLSL